MSPRSPIASCPLRSGARRGVKTCQSTSASAGSRPSSTGATVPLSSADESTRPRRRPRPDQPTATKSRGTLHSGLGLAVAAAAGLRQPDASARVLHALARSRALVLDEMSVRQWTLRSEGSEEAARLFDAWVAARDRLARLTVLGEDEKSPRKYRARLDKARAEKDAAERALADRSWEFRNERTRDAAGLEEVRTALPAGGALVAFVKYPGVPPAKAGAAPPVESYAAFVLRKGAAAPVLVPLGPASAIDDAAAAVRSSLARTANSLGGPGGAPTGPYRRVAAALRDLVWSPLEPHLSGATTVFVVPDGSLHLVSFASLPAGADSWLVETGPVLHYLSAERDLVAPPSAPGSGLLLAGAPDFDAAPRPAARTQTASLRGPVEAEAPPPLHRGPPPSCRDFASLRFVELPAAVREIEDVAAIWQSASRPAEPARRAAPRGLAPRPVRRRREREGGQGRRTRPPRSPPDDARLLPRRLHETGGGGKGEARVRPRLRPLRREPAPPLRPRTGRREPARRGAPRRRGRHPDRRGGRIARSHRRRVGRPFRLRNGARRGTGRGGPLRPAARLPAGRGPHAHHEPLARGGRVEPQMDEGSLRGSPRAWLEHRAVRPRSESRRPPRAPRRGPEPPPVLLGRLCRRGRLALTEGRGASSTQPRGRETSYRVSRSVQYPGRRFW
jgi:hypothetical protein